MKKYLFRALTLLMVGSASVSFVACGSDGDDGGGVVDPTPDDSEKKSAILGTWINSVDDKNYILYFGKDGTGYYIVEGTKEINFESFSKKNFTFTSIATSGTINSGTATFEAKAVGSVEINFNGSSSNNKGEFTVSNDGKVMFTGLNDIEKNIFTKTDNLTTTVDISGLWEGSKSEPQQFSEILINTQSVSIRIDSSNSGYLNSYNYTQNIETNEYSSFSGSVIQFTSYVVTGDIIEFKYKDETNKTEEEKNVGYIRYKKNDLNGYIVSIGGGDQVDIYSNPSAADISTNVKGIWVDEKEENIMLASSNDNLIYFKKNVDSRDNSTFASLTDNDSIIGPYTLLDYNIKVDKSSYKLGKYNRAYKYILVNMRSGNSFLGIYNSTVYGKFTKVADGSSQLTGRWKLDKEITDSYTSTGAIIDNNDIYANNLYQIEFSSNNLLYAYQNAEDVEYRDYKTCYYIATGAGRLVIVEKDNDKGNRSSRIRKQYSTETVGSKLYLKYSVQSYYSTEPQEHVIIYTK